MILERRAWPLLLPLLVLVGGARSTEARTCVLPGVAVVSGSTPARPCTDPCLEAARDAFHECNSSATGALLDTLAGCVPHDQGCVASCRFVRQECRDETGLGEHLALCRIEQDAAEARCRNRFRPLSILRVACLFQAQVNGFQCHNRARRRARRVLRACRTGFIQCASACGPGAPPNGVGSCRADGRTAFRAVVAGCSLAFTVTANACLDKNLTCLQGCTDARGACAAPTQATLGAAIAACTAQAKTAVSACRATNPGGGTGFDQCVITAQAEASACLDAAGAVAQPDLVNCAKQYLRCVRSCPPAKGDGA